MFCSFSAIADQCCLHGTLQLSLISRQPWERGVCGSNTVLWDTAPGWAERSEKLLQVASLHPCEYMSSEGLAVSGQGKVAAAKRKLPSSKKGWRDIGCMTGRGESIGGKCPGSCSQVCCSLIRKCSYGQAN